MAVLANDNGAPRRLRDLLAGPEPVVAPGAYDALSARLGASSEPTFTDVVGLPEIQRLGGAHVARHMELLASLAP